MAANDQLYTENSKLLKYIELKKKVEEEAAIYCQEKGNFALYAE